MTLANTDNIALVLEGGGFRGIFSAGVLEVFLQHRMFFDLAVGVSAGGTYAVSYASRQLERNLRVNDFISDKRYSSVGNLLRESSLFSWDFVFREMPQVHVPLDYEAFKRSSTRLWVGATNCKSGECEFFELNPEEPEHFKTLLAASCSLPLIAPFQHIASQEYMDGGLANSVPYEFALQKGFERAIVILTRPKGYRKSELKFPRFFKYYYRKHPKVAELLIARAANYNAQMEQIEALEKEGKLFVVRPEADLSVKRLENNPQKTAAVYHKAVALTEALLPELRNWMAKSTKETIVG